MAGDRDEAQYASDGVALTLVFALIVALTNISPTIWQNATLPEIRSDPTTVELSLTSSMPDPPATVSVPAPRKVVITRTHPKSIAAAMVPTATEPTPTESQPAPDEAALIATSNPPLVSPAIPTTDYADLNAQYAAALRADIDRRTHPPDSAQYRLHRPAGEVRVRFVVTRNGDPRGVTLLRSSGSPILDQAALTIVAAGSYAPMPADVFRGEREHMFAVTIEFRPPS